MLEEEASITGSTSSISFSSMVCSAVSLLYSSLTGTVSSSSGDSGFLKGRSVSSGGCLVGVRLVLLESMGIKMLILLLEARSPRDRLLL